MKTGGSGLGGQDRLDHVHAMKRLADDPRVDASRAGVTGRSYGGYDFDVGDAPPDLVVGGRRYVWPYDLLTFIDRLPETWKPLLCHRCGRPGEG